MAVSEVVIKGRSIRLGCKHQGSSPLPDLWRWIELSRVHMFAGSMLVFWPCAWGMTMAARTLSTPLQTYSLNLIYGLVGAALSHSAGCVWDDIVDRKFDRQVERTKHRPVADGRVSVPGATVFLAIHIVLLIAMLWPVNTLAWKLGLLAIFPLAGFYPFIKRITYWPQAWLGVSINMLSLVAWGALRARLDPASGALLFGMWCWTIYYDTVYACQDKRDDVQAGVKSTALLFGNHVKKVLAVFAGIFVACLAMAGVMNNQGIPYFILTVGGAAVHLTLQLQNLDVDDPKSCLREFESNGFAFGGIVWSGLFVDYVLG
ncbi:4-hydroxybenzoate polyprenyl transferase [Lactarius akahatsu]|uniref:4-hydroxybenzoate polyprenyltransferase, mitochondrial n=1 Tax=Lactarius akahatsu TaxID=416441 RepID=A0AAD4LAE6_9AGAM|nr:4-hydroxybenzoate polyprenyl transferase [Lactarius akahatsu]